MLHLLAMQLPQFVRIFDQVGIVKFELVQLIRIGPFQNVFQNSVGNTSSVLQSWNKQCFQVLQKKNYKHTIQIILQHSTANIKQCGHFSVDGFVSWVHFCSATTQFKINSILF